jgi:hypothetical protein
MGLEYYNLPLLNPLFIRTTSYSASFLSPKIRENNKSTPCFFLSKEDQELVGFLLIKLLDSKGRMAI